ncbi:MAG: type II toxin-antitoxin system YafQ family toxin [Pararheinheimera sp.]|jgi:mRNA interferase YafQ|nr:type II toxin-antitoxin system YafQ family toxin [Rheinheimera sp.]
MTSKKTAINKRASLPRKSDYTKEFLKDWQRLSQSGRYDMNRLKEVMLMLVANEAPLPAEWLDHALKGDWGGYRECHVGGDFLLIYRVDDSGKYGVVVFTRTGTHSDLFN